MRHHKINHPQRVGDPITSYFALVFLWTLVSVSLGLLLFVHAVSVMNPVSDGRVWTAVDVDRQMNTSDSGRNSNHPPSIQDVIMENDTPTTSRTANRSSYYTNSSYLLALSFEEQLSAASNSMLQLAPLAVDWNAQLVEPVVLRSHLYGIDGLFPAYFQNAGQASIKLSELYDMSKLNDILHSLVSPRVSMVPFEEFISAAPRRVTLLHFNTPGSALEVSEFYSLKSTFQRNGSTVINCSHLKSALKLVHEVEGHLNTALGLKDKFIVEKVLCLDPTVVYRSLLLLENVTHPETIVFTAWLGCSLTNCSVHHKHNSELQKNPDKFRRTILTESAMRRGGFMLRQMHILYRSTIWEMAERYLHTINIRRPFMSIHIRTERLLRDGAGMGDPLYYQYCLHQLENLIGSLSFNMSRYQILLITDIGSKYGTAGCGKYHKLCSVSRIKEVTSALESLNFTTTSYDPRLSNGTENSAYVSLVEMNMLSMGDKLILVGRGGFQTILKDKYLSLNHTEEDLYHICNSM